MSLSVLVFSNPGKSRGLCELHNRLPLVVEDVGFRNSHSLILVILFDHGDKILVPAIEPVVKKVLKFFKKLEEEWFLLL